MIIPCLLKITEWLDRKSDSVVDQTAMRRIAVLSVSGVIAFLSIVVLATRIIRSMHPSI